MKKTWIGLCLAAALCLPLAGCAGDKTGGDITPGASTSPTVAPNGDNGAVTDHTTGTGTTDDGTGTTGGDARMGTPRAAGRSNDSAVERVGEGIKDTLDDMGNGARRMAQDAKRAME